MIQVQYLFVDIKKVYDLFLHIAKHFKTATSIYQEYSLFVSNINKLLKPKVFIVLGSLTNQIKT